MAETTTTAFLSYWGKARRAREGTAFHSAAYHCLDVAAVAVRLLFARPARLQRIAATLGVSPPDALQWLAAWIALHDVGKFSRSFQMQAPQFWPVELGLQEPLPPPARHDDLGRWMLGEALFGEDARIHDAHSALEKLSPKWRRSSRLKLIDAVTGHHGRPPNLNLSFEAPTAVGAALQHAADFIVAVINLFEPPSVEQPGERVVAEICWQLASLTILADWVGSNELWFTYERSDRRLEAYWSDIALRRADRALADAGLLPNKIESKTGLAILAPEITNNLRATDLQLWAERVALPDGPVLAILEDVTGSGKTEAALVLAHRLMVAGRATGLYAALPTMATANAMFERLAQNYSRLFAGGAPSLALAHSARWLHPGFGAVRLKGELGEIGDEAGTAGAQCASWIADDRRKAFLADVGVGTIDQGFFAVLPVRHQALRLWGLPERVLIVDEVHAYDAYMLRELEALIEFQTGLGGSVILLSATLPVRMKQRLRNVFVRAQRGRVMDLQQSGYPLATLVSQNAASEEPCRARPDLDRRVNVKRLRDATSAVETTVEAAHQGAAVAWVRNTVDDAIEAASLLREAGLQPILFHARFAMGDRIGWADQLGREGEVMNAFGKKSTEDERRGRVLVATQVVEQSLDLDFDLLIADLAPIDLLFQRAGRLWRHTSRKRPIAGPTLYVISPDPRGAVGKDWYRSSLPRAAYVYENHAQLWATAQELFAHGGFSVPDDVRRLVEAVYSDERPDIPEPLQRSAQVAQGQDAAKSSIAAQNVLKFTDAYRRDAGLWDSDAVTPTRIGDKRRRLRLARVTDGRLEPWISEVDVRRAWALSEVAVGAHRVEQRMRLPAALEEQARAIEIGWRDYDADVVLLVFQSENDQLTAWAVNSKGSNVRLIYGVDGLCFAPGSKTPD